MPRKLREEVEDGIHHVFARGNNRQVIYRDDDDRRRYLALLGATVERKRWRCLSYCLMDNHVHLLVETPEPNLGAGMQRLHGGYARQFNDRHRRCGHLFQGRFGSNLIADDLEFWTVARYIARNPVEAGRCARARDWVWGSHRRVLDGVAPAWLDESRLFSRFATMGGDGRRTYLAQVDE